jgi:alkanesulfonate monooxygenase SsuD/methylene tetrahydromethanopterin reductase-like flavin-dependent oxidoreductase (luciferase family)
MVDMHWTQVGGGAIVPFMNVATAPPSEPAHSGRTVTGPRDRMMQRPSVGIMHDFRRPLHQQQAYAEYYAECLDEVAEADRLGFDAIWMSEHHLTPDGFLPSPLVMAAAIAAQTNQIRIGTSILILPMHHPLRVAEDAAVADLLSGGRMTLGVGQGYVEREFAAFGVERQHRAALLEQGVDILRQALGRGRVTIHGRHWSFDDVPVTPSPLRNVPIYVGGVSGAALRRALRIGDAIIIYCATPRDLRARRALLDSLVVHTDEFRTASEPTTATPPLVCTSILHVAEDPDQAWTEAAPGIAYLEGNIAKHSNAATVMQDRAQYLVGTPEDIAGRLVALHRELRFSHFAYWARLPGLSHSRAMESLNLVQSRVLPALTGTNPSG